ncbi:MAG: cation diffusion facilitator family transporter [Bacteroidales bacterium]
MNEDILKQKIQRWILSVSFLILCGKFLAFYITNSVGILTDAMESIVNVVAGFITWISLRWASKPKDRQHPFGHGKMEFISASIEGLLIAIAGGLIIYEGIKRLFSPATIEKLDIGIVVVAVAGLLNYLMGWYSVRMGKKYNSLALIAGGKHLQSDTYSSIGLVAGLLVLFYTGIVWIDSALALIFGTIIVITGFSILRKTVANLLDKADNEVLDKIVKSIRENRHPDWLDIHNAKIIKYGSYLYIDCDLTLPWFYNIKESHEACENLKNTFLKHVSEKIQVSIHSDPCGMKHCEHCEMFNCETRQHPFVALEEINISNIVQSDEERNE